jgi:hypothetical protein
MVAVHILFNKSLRDTIHMTYMNSYMYRHRRTRNRVFAVAALDKTGQTVNQVYYFEILKRLREKIRRKRPEL